MVVCILQQLGIEHDGSCHAKQCQSEAPEEEGRSEVVFLSVSHPTLDREDDHDVRNSYMDAVVTIVEQESFPFASIVPLFQLRQYIHTCINAANLAQTCGPREGSATPPFLCCLRFQRLPCWGSVGVPGNPRAHHVSRVYTGYAIRMTSLIVRILSMVLTRVLSNWLMLTSTLGPTALHPFRRMRRKFQVKSPSRIDLLISQDMQS